MKLLRANVRDPDVAQGDLYSLAACNRAGCSRLLDMFEEFGIQDLDFLAEHILSSSERAMRSRIRALPAGEYRHSMRIDGYDEALDLRCQLNIDDAAGQIGIDFQGTSGTSAFGINVPVTYTRAYASFGVRCVVGPEIPEQRRIAEHHPGDCPEGLLAERSFPGRGRRSSCHRADATRCGARMP